MEEPTVQVKFLESIEESNDNTTGTTAVPLATTINDGGTGTTLTMTIDNDSSSNMDVDTYTNLSSTANMYPSTTATNDMMTADYSTITNNNNNKIDFDFSRLDKLLAVRSAAKKKKRNYMDNPYAYEPNIKTIFGDSCNGNGKNTKKRKKDDMVATTAASFSIGSATTAIGTTTANGTYDNETIRTGSDNNNNNNNNNNNKRVNKKDLNVVLDKRQNEMIRLAQKITKVESNSFPALNQFENPLLDQISVRDPHIPILTMAEMETKRLLLPYLDSLELNNVEIRRIHKDSKVQEMKKMDNIRKTEEKMHQKEESRMRAFMGDIPAWMMVSGSATGTAGSNTNTNTTNNSSRPTSKQNNNNNKQKQKRSIPLPQEDYDEKAMIYEKLNTVSTKRVKTASTISTTTEYNMEENFDHHFNNRDNIDEQQGAGDDGDIGFAKLFAQTDTEYADNNNNNNNKLTKKRKKMLIEEAKQQQLQERTKTLIRRYPQLCECIDLEQDIDLTPNKRPITWILKMVEEVYDAAYDNEHFSEQDKVRLQRHKEANLKTKQEIFGSYLSVRGMDLSRTLLEEGATENDDTADIALNAKCTVFPIFFGTWLKKTYGLPRVLKQQTLDALQMIEEHREEYLELEVFSTFLRCLNDDYICLMYLYVRNIIQRKYAISLKDLQGRLQTLEVCGFMRPRNSAILREHHLVTDGTMVPILNIKSVREVSMEVFNDNETIVDFLIERLKERQCIYSYPAGIDTKNDDQTALLGIEVTHFLWSCVEEYKIAPFDIIASYKFNDDGTGLIVLKKLAQTEDDQKKVDILKTNIADLKKDILRVDILMLRKKKRQAVLNQKIGMLDTPDVSMMIEKGEIRTQLLLIENDSFTKKNLLRDWEGKLKKTEEHHKEVWDTIIQEYGSMHDTPADKAPASMDCISNSMKSSIKVFQTWMLKMKVERAAEIEAEENKRDWHEHMYELRVGMAIRIQRAYRRRLYDLDATYEARTELAFLKRMKWEYEEAIRIKKWKEARSRHAVEQRQLAIIREREKDREKRAEDYNESIITVKNQIVFNIADECYKVHVLRHMRIYLEGWKFVTRYYRLKRKTQMNDKSNRWEVWRKKFISTYRARLATTLIQSIMRMNIAKARVGRRRTKANFDMVEARRHHFEHLKFKRRKRHFRKWLRKTQIMLRVHHKYRKKVLKTCRKCTDAWVSYTVRLRGLKRGEAIFIQKYVRRYIAMCKLARLKLERDKANVMQGCARMWVSRNRVKKQIIYLANCEKKEKDIKAWILHKTLKDNFTAWYMDYNGIIKLRQHNLRLDFRLMRRVFGGFYIIYQEFLDRRKAERELENKSATKIQAIWRGHYAKTVTYPFKILQNKKAIEIQRVGRGYIGRQAVKFLLYQHACATKIKFCYIGYSFKRRIHKMQLRDAFESSKMNNVKRLKMYFEKWDRLNDEADENGNNVLHQAAIGGALNTAKVCLRKEMEPNMYNGEGKTVLHLCIESPCPGRDDLCNYLLENEAWIEAPDYDGYTPLLLAAIKGRQVCIRYLLAKGANSKVRSVQGYTVLQLAAENNQWGAVNELLHSGKKVNELGAGGRTVLHESVLQGNVEIAELILNYNALPDITDEDGYTPLMYAVYNRHYMMVRLLMERSADPDVRDFNGRTALHLAVTEGYTEMFQPLYEGNTHIDAPDIDGDTPLHAAVQAQQLESVKLLLGYGIDPTIQNQDGDQAMHLCARLGYYDIMEVFCTNEVPMGRRNWLEMTPIGVAREYDQDEIVALLDDRYRTDELGEDTKLFLTEFQDELNQLEEQWERKWEVATQSYYWVHRETGEISKQAPEFDTRRVVGTRPKLEKPLIPKVPKVFGESDISMADYKALQQKEQAEIKEIKTVIQSVVLMQKVTRVFLARRHEQHLRKQKFACRIYGRKLQNILYDLRERKKNNRMNAITKIQAQIRGKNARKLLDEGLRDELTTHWYRRRLAYHVHRLWRGMKGRHKAERVYAVKGNENRSFLEWQPWREAAGEPRRTLGIFEELCLPGTYSVLFYANTLTSECYWEMPAEWKQIEEKELGLRIQIANRGFTDEQRRASIIIQKIFKGFMARKWFSFAKKGRDTMRTIAEEYINRPDHLPTLLNWTLYNQCILQNYDKTRILYEKLVRLMFEIRGFDVAEILYGYAIFLAATHEDDWPTILEVIERARIASKSTKKGQFTVFDMADSGFFHAATIELNNSESWHQWALCRQLVYLDYHKAEDSFVRAIEKDQANKKCMDNFVTFLRRFKRANYEPYMATIMHHQKQADVDYQFQQRLLDAKKRRQEEHEAAIKTQAIWRGFTQRSINLNTALAGMKITTNNKEKERRRSSATSRRSSTSTGARSTLASSEGFEEWEECEDDFGSVFYYNTKTMESQWEPPNLSLKHLKNQKTTAGIINIHGGDDDLVWEENYTDSGDVYYYNMETGQSVWEKPQHIVEQNIEPVKIDVQVETIDNIWEKCHSDDGRIFYYNKQSGISQWNKPNLETIADETIEEIATDVWEEYMTEDGDPYYYNTVTKETTWDSPW